MEIGKSTIGDILRSSENWLSVSASPKMRKRNLNHSSLEDELYVWFCDVRSRNCAITNEMLIAKARVFGEKLGVTDFAYSRGWLAGLKGRRGITSQKYHGESESAEYDPCDIYNFNETDLLYKLGPNRTLATGTSVSGTKASKERISVGLAANATGIDKLKPVITANFHGVSEKLLTQRSTAMIFTIPSHG